MFLGGGGGAGGTNNASADAAVYTNNGVSCALGTGRCSSGVAGGGTVIIRARQIAGSGVIDVRGAHAFNVDNDAGGGGGGAGGSVVLQTVNGGVATVDVSGGDGGNAFANDTSWPAGRHGPGGSGGGGFVAYAPSAAMSLVATFSGGAPGETEFRSTATLKPIPEYYGSTGFNGGLSTFLAPNVPGVPQAAQCDPNLTLTKSNGVTALASPGSSTYTFTLSNSGNFVSSGTITLADWPTGCRRG